MENISTKNDLAARKHCADFFNTAGFKSLKDVEPHALEWKALRSMAAASARHSRACLDKITDSTPEERAAEIESGFDGLMSLHRALQDEMDIRTEIGVRDARDQEETPAMLARRPVQNAAGSASDEGDAWYERSDSILSPEQRFTTFARAQDADSNYRDLSLGHYFRAMVTGAKTDAERRALAEGTDSAGGYTTPTALSAQLIDRLRAESVVTRAGAMTVPLTSDSNNIAKVLTDPVPAWRLENALVAESDPTFENVPLQPKSLAVLVKVSYELMQDSLNMETELPRIMAAALAVELDRVALLGSGSAPEPTGIANTSGISTAALNGALTNYAPLIAGHTAIKSANAGPVSAIIMAPRDEGTIIGLTAADGQPLMAPAALASIPLLTTTSIPVDGGAGSDESTVFVGDFSKLMVGIRSDIRVEISRSYAMDRLQYTLVCHLRADIAVQHAAAFHTITGVGQGV